MNAAKAHIITQLRKDILPLQGFKPHPGNAIDVGLGPINLAFPNGCFPLAAVHEFLCGSAGETAATGGFISGILSALMKTGAAAAWISSSRKIFPPALKAFGIEPDRIIFIDLKKEKDVPWAIEESLKCSGLGAVIGEMQEISFTTSRRLQLAVEQSRVTGFILRPQARTLNTTACVSRWKISPIPSKLEDGMPGLGFPRWNVELLKVRNGCPGAWQIEWAAGQFRQVTTKLARISLEQQKKTG